MRTHQPGFPAAQLETVFILWGESSVTGTQTRNRPVCSLGGARGVQLAEPERGSEAGYGTGCGVWPECKMPEPWFSGVRFLFDQKIEALQKRRTRTVLAHEPICPISFTYVMHGHLVPG